MIIMVTLSFALQAEAKKKKKSRRVNSSTVSSSTKYPAKPHNPDFLKSCSTSIATIYDPSNEGSMEGGKKTRMSAKSGEKLELVNSLESAAENGKPVTVAMDLEGEFGARCNNKNKDGTETRRCIMLVTLPGLDEKFPAYGKKFKNLPKDSFIAIVEDTGGAFRGKGTGKIDIPFTTKGWAKESPFNDQQTGALAEAKFEILKSDVRYPKYYRERPYNNVNPFVNGREQRCDSGASRRIVNAPAVSPVKTAFGGTGID